MLQKDRKGTISFTIPTRANVGSIGIVGDVPQDAITSPEYQVWETNRRFYAGLYGVARSNKIFSR